MQVRICKDVGDLARQAAYDAAGRLRRAIQDRGEANLVVATGASHSRFLRPWLPRRASLVQVVGFHLDEYLGLPKSHPASFCAYLKQRLVDHLPLRAFHYLDGEADAAAECRRMGNLIRRHPIEVALVGIGENGHLAFNDPPADFQTEEPYIVVDLDDACRRQQFGEGWFPTIDAVPNRALSMSIRQIMKSRAIVCGVPEQRRPKRLRAALEGPVTPQVPASILQQHPQAIVYVDPPAASLLQRSYAPAEKGNEGFLCLQRAMFTSLA